MDDINCLDTRSGTSRSGSTTIDYLGPLEFTRGRTRLLSFLLDFSFHSISGVFTLSYQVRVSSEHMTQTLNSYEYYIFGLSPSIEGQHYKLSHLHTFSIIRMSSDTTPKILPNIFDTASLKQQRPHLAALTYLDRWLLAVRVARSVARDAVAPGRLLTWAQSSPPRTLMGHSPRLQTLSKPPKGKA